MSNWYWIAYAVVIAALFTFAGYTIANSLKAATSHIKGSRPSSVDWEPFVVVGLIIAILIASATVS